MPVGKGEQWYVAVVNGEKVKKTLELNLLILKDEKVSMIYDNEAKSAGILTVKIKRKGKLTIILEPEGGVVIMND